MEFPKFPSVSKPPAKEATEVPAEASKNVEPENPSEAKAPSLFGNNVAPIVGSSLFTSNSTSP
jgi:hypothetical protein